MNTPIKSKKLGKYYINRERGFRLPEGETRTIDENGVLLNKIPYTQKWDYYPCDISLYALGNFEKFLDTNKEKYKNNFLKQANWLANNISIKGGFGVWEHHYILPYYDFNRIPWVHGMAQGLAISVLLRAYQLTDNKIYLETAQKAYGAFEKDIEEEGVRYIDENGNVWLEEYAILPPPHILNGFIFALFGIYDFYRITKSEKSLNLFNEGIKTLEKNLNLYDSGYWSLYNLIHKYPATKNYHELHIKQLRVLYKLTGKDIFNEYAKKWGDYVNKPVNKAKATSRRVIIHVKRYGVKILKIYFLRRRWMKR